MPHVSWDDGFLTPLFPPSSRFKQKSGALPGAKAKGETLNPPSAVMVSLLSRSQAPLVRGVGVRVNMIGRGASLLRSTLARCAANTKKNPPPPHARALKAGEGGLFSLASTLMLSQDHKP